MRVLIAGVASSTGRLLAERLIAGGHDVTGLDSGPCYPPITGLRFVRCRLDRPDWQPALDGIDALVLLTGLALPARRERARRVNPLVRESQAVVQAAAAAGVPKLVTATSAAVYGPQPPGQPIPEGAAVRGHQASEYARARAQVEDNLEILAGSGYNGVLTRLRCAWIVGPHHLGLVHFVRGGPVLACGYENQPLPVVHEEDVIAALALALRDDLPGVYHAASAGVTSWRAVTDLIGEGRACQPLPWLVLRAWWDWRFRGRRTPPGWFRALYESCPLDTRRLRAAGWAPRHTAREALVAALEVLRAGS